MEWIHPDEIGGFCQGDGLCVVMGVGLVRDGKRGGGRSVESDLEVEGGG